MANWTKYIKKGVNAEYLNFVAYDFKQSYASDDKWYIYIIHEPTEPGNTGLCLADH